MISIISYPKRLHTLLPLAAKTTRLIEDHGFQYAQEKRIEEMSAPYNPEEILERILHNTAVAFSENQLQSMVRRELIEDTGQGWSNLRRLEKNA